MFGRPSSPGRDRRLPPWHRRPKLIHAVTTHTQLIDREVNVAHIERRGQGRWRARYRAPDGRERSRTFATKGDAERWLAGIQVARARGEWVDPALARTRLDAWAERWLEMAAPSLRASTLASYESLVRSRVVPALGRFRLGDLRPSDVQDFVNDLAAEGLSVSRIRKCRIVLGLMLDAAVRDGIIARNVARGARLPRATRREAAYFEPEVVDSIVADLDEPYALLVRVLGLLGLRYGEAIAIQRQAVDLLHRRILIQRSVTEVSGRLVWTTPKSHAERQAPLPPSLARALEQHLSTNVGPEAHALVFTSANGGVVRLSNFNHRIWRPVLRRLGLPVVGVHVLRHSAAARMIAAGASPKAVQTVLGHANAGFTLSVYGHMFDADLDDLATRLDEPRTARPAELSRPVRGLRAVDRQHNTRATKPDQHKRRGAGRNRTFDRGIMSPLL
jgi:integrase